MVGGTAAAYDPVPPALQGTRPCADPYQATNPYSMQVYVVLMHAIVLPWWVHILYMNFFCMYVHIWYVCVCRWLLALGLQALLLQAPACLPIRTLCPASWGCTTVSSRAWPLPVLSPAPCKGSPLRTPWPTHILQTLTAAAPASLPFVSRPESTQSVLVYCMVPTINDRFKI